MARATVDGVVAIGLSDDHPEVEQIRSSGVPIVGNETAEDSRESDGLRRVRRRKLTISRDPSGDFGGVAAPVQTGTVAIDGEAWAIESIKCLSRDVFDLVAVRHEAQARSRADLHGPGFRRENQ